MMKTFKLGLCAALVGASTLAMAFDNDADAARERRMNEALERYHDSRNANPGPAARTEESIKRGMHKTGRAIKHGAHKTANAVRRTGQKIQDKTRSD